LEVIVRLYYLFFLCLAATALDANKNKDQSTPLTAEEAALIVLVDEYFTLSQSPESHQAKVAKATALNALEKYLSSRGMKTDEAWRAAFLHKLYNIHLEEEERDLRRRKKRASQKRKTV
jgi:hypothetical protein